MDEKFAKWKDIDRTKIKWNPIIDEVNVRDVECALRLRCFCFFR